MLLNFPACRLTPFSSNWQSVLSQLVLPAEAAPGLRLIPGSVEQRGTDLIKAMKGDIPFIRSASALAASLT